MINAFALTNTLSAAFAAATGSTTPVQVSLDENTTEVSVDLFATVPVISASPSWLGMHTLEEIKDRLSGEVFSLLYEDAREASEPYFGFATA